MCEKCYFDVVSQKSSNYFYQNNLTFTYHKLVIIIYFYWLEEELNQTEQHLRNNAILFCNIIKVIIIILNYID